MNYSFSFLNNFFQRNLTKQKTDHATSNSRNSYEKKGTVFFEFWKMLEYSENRMIFNLFLQKIKGNCLTSFNFPQAMNQME
jgi:hypothetical protein